MSKEYVSKSGLQSVLTLLKNEMDKKVSVVSGKGLSTNDYDNDAVAEVAKIKDKVDAVSGMGLSSNDYDAAAVAEVAKISGKVDSVAGKGLSTNDLTDDLKAQYDAAEANVITSVKVNGTALTITDKAVNVTVPTVDSEMSDSSTNAVQNKVIKAYIDGALDDITGVEYETATSFANLPATGAKGTIYLVPNSGSGNNIYDEYIWSTDKYEKIGTTETNLTGYLKDTDVVDISTADIYSAFNTTFGTSYSTAT